MRMIHLFCLICYTVTLGSAFSLILMYVFARLQSF